MIKQTNPPLADGWHWAERENEIEMVLAGRQFAGKVWNPVLRRQFEVSEYSAWWRVLMPKAKDTNV